MKTITKTNTKAQSALTTEQLADIAKLAKLNNIEPSKMYNGVTGEALLSAIWQLNNFQLGEARGGHGHWAKGALKTMKLVVGGEFMKDFDAFEETCNKVTAAHIALVHAYADARLAQSEAKQKPTSTHKAVKAMTAEDFHGAARNMRTLLKGRKGEFFILLEGAAGSSINYFVSLKNFINDHFYTPNSDSRSARSIKKGNVYTTKR